MLQDQDPRIHRPGGPLRKLIRNPGTLEQLSCTENTLCLLNFWLFCFVPSYTETSELKKKPKNNISSVTYLWNLDFLFLCFVFVTFFFMGFFFPVSSELVRIPFTRWRWSVGLQSTFSVVKCSRFSQRRQRRPDLCCQKREKCHFENSTNLKIFRLPPTMGSSFTSISLSFNISFEIHALLSAGRAKINYFACEVFIFFLSTL